jgi:hypothetical protein
MGMQFPCSTSTNKVNLLYIVTLCYQKVFTKGDGEIIFNITGDGTSVIYKRASAARNSGSF